MIYSNGIWIITSSASNNFNKSFHNLKDGATHFDIGNDLMTSSDISHHVLHSLRPSSSGVIRVALSKIEKYFCHCCCFCSFCYCKEWQMVPQKGQSHKFTVIPWVLKSHLFARHCRIFVKTKVKNVLGSQEICLPLSYIHHPLLLVLLQLLVLFVGRSFQLFLCVIIVVYFGLSIQH